MNSNKLIRSLIYMLTSSGFVVALSVVITLFLARLLPPKDLGLILAAEAFIELFNFFFRTGFRNSLLKFSAHDPNGFEAGLNKAVSNAFLVKLIVVIPGCILVYLISHFTQKDPVLLQLICIYTWIYILEAFASIFGIARRALGQFKLMSVLNTFDKVLRIGVIYLVLVLMHGDLIMLLWAFLIEKIVRLTISALTTFRLLKIEFDFASIMPMFKESCSYGLLDTLENAQSRIDRVMINSLLGSAAVAYYAVPAKLNKTTLSFSQTISHVFLPRLHDTIINDHERFTKTTKHLSRFLAFVGIFAFIFVYYYAEMLLHCLFGDNYSESITIVKFFAFINLLWFLEQVPQLILMTQAAHTKRFAIRVVSIILGILINYYFIAKIGILGVVYANIITSLLRFISSAWFTRAYIEVGQILAIIFLPLSLVYFLPIQYLLTLYLAYIAITGLISKQDIEKILEALKIRI